MLTPAHHQQLTQGSGLSDALIAQRGYCTLSTSMAIRQRGFSPEQAKTAPALGIPLWNVHGQQAGWQIRPDQPRQDEDGDDIKYETPAGGLLTLDVHPSIQPLLRDVTRDLWITEGVKKGTFHRITWWRMPPLNESLPR